MRFQLSAQEIAGIGIVAGTAIGASMLSLPFSSGVCGFWLGCFLLIVGYFYSMASLLLWLEVTLYTKDTSANFITIAKERLGPIGERIVWLTYLALLYTIPMSYIAGGGDLLMSLFKSFGYAVPVNVCQFIYTALFGLVAFRGVYVANLFNQILLVGMLVSYLGLIGFIAPNMSLQYLEGGNSLFIWSGIPIAVSAFACHFVVPTLRKNFSADTLSLRKMLWIGTSIPLIVYTIYELLIVSVLPFDGSKGLLAISATATPLAGLQDALEHSGKLLPILLSSFSNCALLTSFLGVVIALSDFLQDGISLREDHPYKTLITAPITLGPPLLMAFMLPSSSPGFIIALEYTGLLVAFLFGILPVIMAWQARYHAKLSSPYVLPGGKGMLMLVAILSVGIMITVLGNNLDLLPTPRSSAFIQT